MSKFFSGLPYYGLIGWCGLWATISMFASFFVDWAFIPGWLTIFSTTIIFYVTTIEADFVECEWASFITIPAGIFMIFASSYPFNALAWIVGPFALAYATIEYYPAKFPRLAKWLKVPERRAVYLAKRAERLEKARQEQAKAAAFNQEAV